MQIYDVIPRMYHKTNRTIWPWCGRLINTLLHTETLLIQHWNSFMLKFSLKKQKKKKANKKKQIQKQKNTFHTYLLGRKPSKEKFLQEKGKKSNKFSFFNVPHTHLYLTFFFLFKLKSERKSTWKVFLLLSHTLVWYSWRDILSKHVMFLLWSYIDVRDEIRVMHKEHRLVQGRRKKKRAIILSMTDI